MYDYRYGVYDRRPAYLAAGTICLGVIATIYGLWPYVRTGEVTAMTWDRFIHRERFERQTAEDWRMNLDEAPIIFPRGGKGEQEGCENVRDCEQRYHHSDSYACGTSCSGSGKNRSCRTRYCSRPVYYAWCRYDHGVWARREHTRAFGDGRDVSWPEPPALQDADLERHAWEGQYLVTVDYDDGGPERYVEVYDNGESYLLWNIGDPVVVHLRAWTGVSYVEHVSIEAP